MTDYFTNLFCASDSDYRAVTDCVSPAVSETHNHDLLAPILDKEVRDALFTMHPDKASGPDGMSPAFFQKHWDIMGKDVVDLVKRFFNTGIMDEQLNNTNIVLIPKKKNPCCMGDLRPISLCNVLYKIISKVPANRMKKVLDQIISVNQSAFISGRLISDNILICYEIMHYLKRKTVGKEGFMAVKLDMSKAYDRVEWSFLQAMLSRLGFHQRWTNLIMACVTSVRYQIVHGGSEFGSIVPTRGLRQGDPLSPYLFITCAEGLSALIRNFEGRGKLKGCRVANGAPRISHMFFADDSYVFGRATSLEADNLLNLLGTFEKASGQKVNIGKSSVFYSRNTSVETRVEVCRQLQMEEASDESTYLGLPNILGRKKSVLFGFLKEKVRKKIQNWDNKILSRAGKEILIKTVAQALPNYAMSVFLLPVEICKDLERMMSRFWWRTSTDKERGIHWMSWERMCKPKVHGGLGFRCLRSFNIALLAKQGWKLTMYPESLVGQIFRARYYPEGSFLTAKLGHSPSFVWRSILEAQEVVKRGLCWRVQSGRLINILNEPWLLNEADPFVKSHNPTLEGCKVSSLMIEGSCAWDRNIIERLFCASEAAAILSIPLPREGGIDNLFWRWEKSGIFSVKSAYRMLAHNPNGNNWEVETLWQKLWKIKIPPKGKNLMWRATANCLPTKVSLRGKNVDIDTLCPQCRVGNETILHCLVECPFAVNCWTSAGFTRLDYDGVSFAGWLRLFMQRIDEEGVCRAAMLCWAIWRARNELVWNGKGSVASEVVVTARLELDQWTSAKEKGLMPSFSTHLNGDGAVHWSTPVGNTIKVNVDAAIFENTNKVGIGFVARDRTGSVLEAGNMAKRGTISPGIAEAIGVREALSWIKKKGWREAVIESDCLVVVQAVRSEVAMLSYFGSIITECKNLLRELCKVDLVFVRRSANRVAHHLARASYFSSDRMFDADSVPTDIQAFVLDDISV